MSPKEVADWLIVLLALIGAGIALGAGLVIAAGVLKGALICLRAVTIDMITWSHLREAVDEWKARHPDKAARYQGEGPWRHW